MTDTIPITFYHNEKKYKGMFNKVSGAGSTSNFHLMINNFYQGQIFYSENYGWRYASNSGEFDELSDFFGDYITAYIQ